MTVPVPVNVPVLVSVPLALRVATHSPQLVFVSTIVPALEIAPGALSVPLWLSLSLVIVSVSTAATLPVSVLLLRTVKLAPEPELGFGARATLESRSWLPVVVPP